MSNIPIKLDFNGQELANPVVKMRKGDGDVLTIDVDISNNGTQVDLSKFKIGQFRGTNAVNLFVEKDVERSSTGKFSFTFPKNVSADAGAYKRAYFVFMDDKDGQVSTADFPLYISEYSDASSEHADVLIDQFNDFVKQLQKIYDAAKLKIDNLIIQFGKDRDAKFTDMEARFVKQQADFKTEFDKQIATFKSDYQKWRDSIQTDINSLTDQLPGFKTQIDDILKKIKDGNVVTTSDATNWQKNAVTKENGDFFYKFAVGKTPTIIDAMANENGIRTFYQPNGTEGNNVKDSIRGVINTVNGWGNAIGVGNGGIIYIRNITLNNGVSTLSDWKPLATGDDLAKAVYHDKPEQMNAGFKFAESLTINGDHPLLRMNTGSGSGDVAVLTGYNSSSKSGDMVSLGGHAVTIVGGGESNYNYANAVLNGTIPTQLSQFTAAAEHSVIIADGDVKFIWGYQNTATAKELSVAEIDKQLNILKHSKWSKVFTDITLQNGYGAYGGSGNQWYYFKDEPNEDGEIVRNVRFNLTMTNKNGSKSGDNPAKFPTSVIPTIQIAFTAGGSGSEFYEYVLTTDGTLNIHGTTSNATTNKNPWMIFNNGYTFIIPKTDSRWYDMTK